VKEHCSPSDLLLHAVVAAAPLLGVAPSLQQLASLGEVVAAVVLSYTLDPVHEANSPPPSVISPQVATNDVPVLLHF
jgi:hypothetical protein